MSFSNLKFFIVLCSFFCLKCFLMFMALNVHCNLCYIYSQSVLTHFPSFYSLPTSRSFSENSLFTRCYFLKARVMLYIYNHVSITLCLWAHPPSPIHMLKPNLQCDGFRRRGIGRGGHKDGALMNGITALTKKTTQRAPSPLLPCEGAE